MRFLLWLLPSLLAAQTYDIVLQRGRLMDPESGFDAMRNVGITGRWKSMPTGSLSPGFIDLHQHSQTPEAYRLKAMDGVTTALELEVGTSPVSEWYAARQGKSLIHFGTSAGHIPTLERYRICW